MMWRFFVSPMGRVDGKTVLVTGASRGIGRTIAIALAREGAKVATNYSSSDAKANEVAEEIKKLGGTAILCKGDIGNSYEVRAMVEKVALEFTHLDILLNNAGITRDSLLSRMTDEQWVPVIRLSKVIIFPERPVSVFRRTSGFLPGNRRCRRFCAAPPGCARRSRR
jgi:NAD(P)-dependent dehydrogenase (short-subunit alcohol dehydrogenase family)